jgi:hypothetical protein
MSSAHSRAVANPANHKQLIDEIEHDQHDDDNDDDDEPIHRRGKRRGPSKPAIEDDVEQDEEEIAPGDAHEPATSKSPAKKVEDDIDEEADNARSDAKDDKTEAVAAALGLAFRPDLPSCVLSANLNRPVLMHTHDSVPRGMRVVFIPSKGRVGRLDNQCLIGLSRRHLS